MTPVCLARLAAGEGWTTPFLAIGHLSVHCWLVPAGRGFLLVDNGYPAKLPHLVANLRRKGLSLGDVGSGLRTGRAAQSDPPDNVCTQGA